MARMPVRLRDQQHRLPEQGLIKYGVKDEARKGAPKAIEWFRFCSSNRTAIVALAGLYGGTVMPWQNGYGRAWWQVTTTTSEIRVVLPPEPLGDGPIYERWKGGGCERRCDGETCTIPRGMHSDPNPEPQEVDCLCDAEQALTCKPHTRLKVVLPELTPFMGYWRLEAKGDHAKDELPGMCQVVLDAQGRGMTYALLRLEQRSEYGWNDRTQKRELHHYVTPVVGPSVSFDALLAGGARARALGPADTRLALTAAPPPTLEPEAEGVVVSQEPTVVADDGITDAEVVEDAMSQWEDPDALDQAAIDYETEKLQRAITWNLLKDTPLRHALVRRLTKGRTESTKDLGLDELRLLKETGEKIRDGRLHPVLVDGEVSWEKASA